jgi:hypothetical protein
MAAGLVALGSPIASQSSTVDTSFAESAPTSEQVIAYLLKGDPPKLERRFREIPANDREGLRLGTFENIQCTDKTHYQGRPYWRCFYTLTAFTRSGAKLASRSWEFLGHDGKGGLQPIMLEVVVPTPPSTNRIQQGPSH